MDSPKKSNLSRSSSRSRRSQVNLANVRLAPLSTKFSSVTTTAADSPTKTPNASTSTTDASPSTAFRRSHSSYIHGKSAPTSPGLLSRSSSGKHLSSRAGRRASFYDDEDEEDYEEARRGAGAFDYAGVVRGEDGSARVEVGSGRIPKAKSEAALLVQRSKLAGARGVRAKKVRLYPANGRGTGRSDAGLVKGKTKGVEEDWLTRTGAATNALVQETKGQSWIASRTSSTSLVHLQDSTDEDDEGYEELAAQSAAAEEALGATSARASQWGSRYGSRSGSRRTSRRGSVTLTTGSRTPLATLSGQDGARDYFEHDGATVSMEPDFVDAEEDSEQPDEVALNRLAETRSFGVGGIVDRIMHLSLFQVEEREEATEDEFEHAGETEEQAKQRMEAEARRRREEKQKLVNRADTKAGGGEGEGEGGGGGGGGWASDAAWLLGIASRAIL